MRLLRIYYNWLLVRLRIRKILPAFFITRIPVKECGEPLVVYAGVLMREAVAEMLGGICRKGMRSFPYRDGVPLLNRTLCSRISAIVSNGNILS